MTDEAKILEMKQEIQKGRRLWRVPLFILGAGVSAEKVWTMYKILDMLGQSLKQHEDFDLAWEAERIANDIFYQSRAVASKLFGTLQEKGKYKTIWSDFTKKFLEEGQIWVQEPTHLHYDIAEQVVSEPIPALVLSINYDGLTAKAIKKRARLKNNEQVRNKVDLFYPCRILSSADDIEKWFSRDVKVSNFYPLIKLRGDIFNAVCENEECRLFGQRTPIYEIPPPEERIEKVADVKTDGKTQLLFNMESSKDQEIYNETKNYEEAIRCPFCSKNREIELDFPGARIKELEAERIMKALIRYVIPTLSCIVVFGVSGRWDPEIVEFLRVCAIERGIKIYYFNRSDILRSQCRWATDNNFVYISERDFGKWKKGTLRTSEVGCE